MNTLRTFYSKYPTIKVSKGAILFQQSDVPKKAYAVKRGVVRICNINSDGVEKIISFKVMNEPFPVCWILSKTTSALFYYQTHTDCELYVIDKNDFNEHLQKDQAFTRAILDILGNAYVNTSLQIDALVQTRATVKILYAFRHLCLRYGQDIPHACTRIQIPLTQQELANYTGLTRETTTLELNRLKAAGVVLYKSKYYSVNTSKLNDRIDDEYNPGVESDLQTLSKSLIV